MDSGLPKYVRVLPERMGGWVIVESGFLCIEGNREVI